MKSYFRAAAVFALAVGLGLVLLAPWQLRGASNIIDLTAPIPSGLAELTILIVCSSAFTAFVALGLRWRMYWSILIGLFLAAILSAVFFARASHQIPVTVYLSLARASIYPGFLMSATVYGALAMGAAALGRAFAAEEEGIGQRCEALSKRQSRLCLHANSSDAIPTWASRLLKRRRKAPLMMLHFEKRPTVKSSMAFPNLHRPLLRDPLLREIRYREEDSGDDLFENLYWCTFLLCRVGSVSMVAAIFGRQAIRRHPSAAGTAAPPPSRRPTSSPPRHTGRPARPPGRRA